MVSKSESRQEAIPPRRATCLLPKKLYLPQTTANDVQIAMFCRFNFSIRRKHGQLMEKGERSYKERVSRASGDKTKRPSASSQRLVQKQSESSNQTAKVDNEQPEGTPREALETQSSVEEDWDRLHDTITTVLTDTACCIRDRFFIGSFLAEQNRDDLVKNRITHILQIGEGMTQSYQGEFLYKTIIMADTARTSILGIFRECIEFMEACLSSGGSLLVHCYAGVSRSPTICIAYLMWKENLTVGPAYSVVQQARSVAQPNDGFRQQLQIFESLSSDLDLLDNWNKGMAPRRHRKQELSTDDFEIYC